MLDVSRKPPGFNTVFKSRQFDKLKAELLSCSERACRHLYPDGRKEWPEWCVGSVDGERGRSFKINLKTGIWKEFDGDGAGGNDLIALWALARGIKQGEAYDEAAAWLGWAKPNTAPTWVSLQTENGRQVEPPPPANEDQPRAGDEDKWWRKVDPKDVKKYNYFDADGELWATVRRWDRGDGTKRVRPWHHKSESEKWPEGLRPLYKLDRIAKTTELPIHLVEGEKCADVLNASGYVATSCAGGSKAVGVADWSPLKGRDVVRWADNDAAGEKWLETTRAALEAVGVRSIKDVAIPAGKPDGWDCADATPEEVRALIKGAGAPAAPPRVIASRDLSLKPVYSIPKRRFVYGHIYQRGKITITAGIGGSGKSALHVVEALAIATGRDLLETGQPIERCKVWLIVLEDDEDELHRRIGAALMHFNVDPSEIKGWIRITVAEEAPLFKIATSDRNGTQVSAEAVAAVKADIAANDIGFWIVDPYVYAHDTNENDNSAQSLVMNALADIARSTNSACALVHHAKKPNASDKDGPSSGDIRGASALVNSARHGRIVNTMSASEAAKMDVSDDARFYFFRASSVKANYSPPGGRSGNWYKLNSVRLPNGEADEDGDGVGVVTKWTPPDPFKMMGITVDTLRAVQAEYGRAYRAGTPYRVSSKAVPWAGEVIGNEVGLDPKDKGDRGKIVKILKTWIESGALVEDLWNDGHQKRPIIRPGPQA